jgi:hypothetical protein
MLKRLLKFIAEIFEYSVQDAENAIRHSREK